MRKFKRFSLRNVNIESVLQKLEIPFERKEDELYAKCPNPEHQDRKPSWHIKSKLGDENNGLFNCWSCGWKGNLVSLVASKRKCDFAEARLLIDSFRKQLPEVTYKVEPEDYIKNIQGIEPPEISLEWKGKPIDVATIEQGSEAFAYLMSRMIGSKFIESEGLLAWSVKKRIIIPITRKGKLISWVARSYCDAKPKVIAPAGAPKKWELIGLDQLDRSIPLVNVCEGWVDRVRLMQVDRINVCALCGSKMSEYQAEALLFAKKIVLWLDGDKAGEVMGQDLAAWLGRGRELFVVPFEKGRDPGSFSPAELVLRQPITWSEYQQRRKS